MVWLLLTLVVFIAIWGIGVMRAPARRAPNILNNLGFPRTTSETRRGHGENDEE